MSRFSPLSFVLLLACSPELATVSAPEASSVPPPVTEDQIRDAEDLTDGVHIQADTPFQSLTLVFTLDPEASVELLLPDGVWQTLNPLEDLGQYRTYAVSLEQAVEEAWVRVTDGKSSFAEITTHEGAEPSWDDDGVLTDLEQQRAQPGRWMLPAAIWAAGQAQYLAYTPATSCSGRLTSGARAVGTYLVDHFEATSFGGYNCRNIGGTNTLSVHSTGRALDIYVPIDGWGSNSADNDLGDPLASWLVENAEHIGISYIIWDKSSWGAHRSGDKHRTYGGAHPHNNHLHIELTPQAAREETDWFLEGGPGSPPFAIHDRYLIADFDGDGTDDLAVRRNSSVLADADADGLYDHRQIFGLAELEDDYFAGDFDGDGTADLAVRRAAQLRLETNGDSLTDTVLSLGNGPSEDAYLHGDFDGDGQDDFAVRRGNSILADPDRNGIAEIVVDFPSSAEQWLIGDFDGDGIDDIGQRVQTTVSIDLNLDGQIDLTRTLWSLGDAVHVGDFDGDGTDELAVREGADFQIDLDGTGTADLIRTFGSDPGADPGAPGLTQTCWPGRVEVYDQCVVLDPAAAAGYTYPPPGTNRRPPVAYLDLSDLSPDDRLAPNFKLRELADTHSDDFAVLQVHAVEKLQQLRDQHGALYIDAGYVRPETAEALGWGTTSRHSYGDAFDIRPVSASMSSVRQSCIDLGGHGTIYGDHVHCDFRDDAIEPDFFGN